jgi:hypothetical protein
MVGLGAWIVAGQAQRSGGHRCRPTVMWLSGTHEKSRFPLRDEVFGHLFRSVGTPATPNFFCAWVEVNDHGGDPSAMNTPKIRALGIVQDGSPTRWKATGDVEGIGWLEAWGTSLVDALMALQARAAEMAREQGTAAEES